MSVMLTYFDEVKHEPGKHSCFWLGALAVDAHQVRPIEAQVSALAKECFGTTALARHTEFHTSALINRRDHFNDWDTSRRIDALTNLLRILDQHDLIAKIMICLHTDRMVATDFEAKAFLFLTEKLQQFLVQQDAVGLLIGDRESDQAAAAAASDLSDYRATGTPFPFGRNITRLIDTVHFTHSHLSRMLQLADLYVWTLHFCATTYAAGSAQEAMQMFIRQETRILSPHKYKDWPSKYSWVKVSK